MLQKDGFRISSCGLAASQDAQESELRCELRWRTKAADTSVPPSVSRLLTRTGVVRVEWTPLAQ